MKQIGLLLTILLIVPIVSANIPSDFVTIQSSTSHTFQLHVVFVGFAQAVVDTTLIDSNVQKSYSFSYEDGEHIVNYIFNVSYHFTDALYYQALKTFALANSVNGTNTTSAINATALQIQRDTGTRMSVFLPQSGRAIDAKAVEDWFVANPYLQDSESSYCFYVMNFTEFDSADHKLEHWYNATEWDYEANNMRDFWRLEWDNALNPNVRFPYAAFTSQSRVLFIDPSAFQWYLTWARIWWRLSLSGPKYDYYFEDLDQFLATHDVRTSGGKTALAYYLAGWIEDPLRNLLAPSCGAWYVGGAKSLSVQTLILNNASEAGYANDAMRWMVNTTLCKMAIEDLAPFIDVEITVNFQNLTNYPALEAIFDNAVISKQNGWTYYEGTEIWTNLYNVRSSYFNLSAADIVINAYIFLECNMSMIYAGNEFTGLGGGGQILVMKAVERYFEADGVTPKSGLGAVLIHEAGHNLGFPHTFSGRAYAGDFAFDVMGYYPYSYYFTQLRKDCLRRLVDDCRNVKLNEILDEDKLLYSRKSPNATIDVEFDKTYNLIADSGQLYNELNFLKAYDKLTEAENQEKSLNELVWVYLCDLNNDTVINIFDVVTVCIAYGSKPGDDNWNPNADLIQNNFIDIFDVVAVTSRYGRRWQTP
jgi:hypothetical protein